MGETIAMKVVLIVLDSVGIGEAPDAAEYGDVGSATLQHIGETVGGLKPPSPTTCATNPTRSDGAYV